MVALRRTRRFPIIVAALSLAVLAAACDSREQRAADAAAKADQLMQLNNPMGASILIREALAERDDVAAYWLLLARSQMMLQKYGAAYSAYLRVLELDRGNMEALLAAAELSFAGGQVEDADKYADQVLAVDAQNIRGFLVKGSVALKRKKLADADQFAQQALRIDPTVEGGTILRARVMMADGRSGDAVALLDQSLAARGDTQASLLVLMEIFQKANDTAGIERTFARLFRLEPDNAALRLDYARELYLNGKGEIATTVIDELQNTKPDDANLQNRIVDLWVEVGDDAATSDQIRRMASGGDAMRIALARYFLETGRAAQTEEMLRSLADGGDVTAANVEPRILYAMAQNELGRRKDAFARANAVLAFDQTNPRGLMLRARIMAASGNFDQALQDARVLVRDNPDLEEPRVVLGEIYQMRGDDGLADATFQQALKDFPQSARILAGYMDFLTAADRRPQALLVAAQFTAHNPDQASGWEQRGKRCVALGDEGCVHAAMDALSGMRGGDIAKREIAGELALRDRRRAGLSAGARTAAAQVQSGQADLGSIVGGMLKAGNIADAEALVRYMIVAEPRNSVAPVLLGAVQLRQGRTSAAERQFEASIAKFPGQPRAYSDLARLRFDRGDRPGAFAVMSQGLNRLKGNPLLLKDLAVFQERAGDPGKAIETYRSVLQNTPNDLLAINNLAALLTDHGPRPEALGEAELLARRLTTGDNPLFLDTRGWLKLQRGERVEAVQLLRKAVASEGAQPVFHYHLAEALAATGDRAGAKVEVGRALAGAEAGDAWIGKARGLMGRL